MIARVPRPAALPAASEKLVVVEASAGTGKTFFLEHRVADLILAGAELSQILLVTFTDKAVAELRMRIRDLLDRLSRAETTSAEPGCWEIDDDGRARLRAAVIGFDSAPIFTIHGFCHRVLIEDAFAARRLFDQQQVADEVAFDEAFSALLRERFSCVSPDKELLAAYLSYEGTVDKLRDLLLACARKDAEPRRHFDPAHALAIGETLRAEAGTPAQRDQLRATLPWKTAAKNVDAWLDLLGDALDRWDGTAVGVMALCEQLGDKAEKIATRAWSRPALQRALESAMNMMSLDEAVAVSLLPQVIDRIGIEKAERGLFDYQDMLDLVRDALAGQRGPELAARLRTRMPWVMIDEFQDTDQVQWEIFRTVWLHDDARGLTIVGDPKQAIYGFRGADVMTYMQARDELIDNGARRVALTVNRRSTAALVDALNALMRRPIGELLDRGIRYDEPVTAAGDITCSDPRPPITVFQLGPDGGNELLATAIGVEIERLRAAAPVWHSRGVEKPFSLGQVMVLTRANKESSAIAASLRARGLPCAVVESEGLFQTREAAELAAVLDAIAAPRDRSARLRALRTRFFDVRWDDLMRVVDAPDHHPAIARLFDWAALAARREYETLFRRLVEDSRFADRALVLGGGERAIVNTWHVLELLLEEVARSRGDLHELVAQLRRWIAEHEQVPDDRDVQRAETDAEAIRVLTVHKAKGLEAPYVFLYGGAGKPPHRDVHTLHDAAGRALVVGTPASQKDALENEDVGENQRLAYVALTRAQLRLYLPQYPRPVKTSLYQQIQRCLLPYVNDADRRFELVAVDAVEDPPAPLDALSGFDPPAPPVTTELAPIARAGLVSLSYTRLAREAEAAKAPPVTPALEIVRAEGDAEPDTRDAPDPAELAPDELPPGADAGLFLHDLFEHVDIRAAAVTDAQLAEFGRQRGIAPAYFAHASRVVHDTLTKPLGELPPLTEATALAREVAFAYPLPGGGGLVKGFIDALVVYGDDLWVLDYKSDRLADPEHARDHVDDHYLVQARLYALAADRMRGTRRLRGLLFAFVRHGIVVPMPVEDTTLVTWTSWLEGLR